MSILPQITMPTLSDRHLAELELSGLRDKEAIAAGHQSVSPDDAKVLAGHELPGLLFSYHDPEGNPYRWGRGKWKNRPFCRLKPSWDEVSDRDRRKYQGKYGDLPKYLSPGKAGNRPYFSRLWSDWSRTIEKSSEPIDFTEGEKKADAACANGFATIGLSGVTCQKDHTPRNVGAYGSSGSSWDVSTPTPEEDNTTRFIPELEVVRYNRRTIGICFDSDITFKLPVQFALASLARDLEDRGANPFPIILPTELNGEKNGLDDFIARHGADAYDLLRKTWLTVATSRHKLLKRGRGKDAPLQFHYSEPINHVKAVMAWSILKDELAYRPAIGWYRWSGRTWRHVTGDDFNSLLIEFCDAQGWIETGAAALATIERHLKGRLAVPEEKWNRHDRRTYSNGTYHFDVPTFISGFNPLDFQTIGLDYDWQPFGGNPWRDCPSWMKFLSDATGGDGKLIELLQAILKWALVPKKRDRPFSVEQIFDLVGLPGTGKGTFLETLIALAGANNVASFDQDTLKSAEGRSMLLDKLIAIDLDAQGHWGKTGLLNKVVSNEPVPVRRLYNDGDSQRLGVVLFRAMNQFQSAPSGSQGLDRRILPIRFDNIPLERDEFLKDKIRDELGAIAAWVWSIGDAEMKRRIKWAGDVPNVAETRVERFEANNSIFRWLSENHPDGVSELASTLYQDYRTYTQDGGSTPQSLQNFGSTLTSWQPFSVNKCKTREGIHYTIPSVETLLGAGLLPLGQEKSCEGTNGCEGSVKADVKAQNPHEIRSVQEVKEKSEEFAGVNAKKIETPLSDPPPQAFTSCTPSQNQGLQLIPKPSRPEKPSHKPCERRSRRLRVGDTVRYHGPGSLPDVPAFGVIAKGRSLTIQELDLKKSVALVRHQGWAVHGYWVPVRYLRS